MDGIDISTFEAGLAEAFGHPISLDDSTAGTRATAFFVLALAVASEMARADNNIHPAEELFMRRILSGIDIVPDESACLVRSVLTSKALSNFIIEGQLPRLARLLDPIAATLIWGVALSMSVVDANFDLSEAAFLNRLRGALPVDPKCASALERALIQNHPIGMQERIALSIIHPSRVLSLGVGASRLAADLLMRLDSHDSAEGTFETVASDAYIVLEKYSERRRQMIDLLDAAKPLAPFVNREIMNDANWARLRLAEGRFRLTVLGEFSRGKSTLINALLGGPILPRSIAPCNNGIVRLRYGKEPRYILELHDGMDDRMVSASEFRRALFSVTEDDVGRRLDSTICLERGTMELPHPFLVQGIELLDTPGLNENARLEQIVEEEAGRSDAFVLVLSGMQPVTRLETEAILKISAREKPIFIVCNFMNAVPTAQRPLVEKRVKTTVAKLAPAANVQFWFVSAEPALLHLMCDKVDESDAIWTQEIVDLRRSLVKFLAEERGSVEIHNTQICLRTYLSKAQAAIEQRIETDRLAEDTQRDEKEDLLRRDAEWLRTEEKEIPQRRKRMRLQVQRFEEELCARTCDIADQVMNDLAKELPASAKRWKSESSALMPWAVARDYGKQVEHFFERQLNERIRRSLAPIIDELVHQLAKNLGQDAAVLYQTASGATVGQVSIAAAKEDPESAGIRLLKTVVGVALVGPAGLAAGAAPISHIIAMAVSAFAVAFLIAFLGGGPITAAIGIATSTVLIIFVGADGMKDAIRDKLILKIVQEIPGMREDVHESIKKEIEKKGKAILAELDREIKRLEQETRLRLNEIEEDIAQLKSSPRLYSSRFEQKLALTKQLIERLSEI